MLRPYNRGRSVEENNDIFFFAELHFERAVGIFDHAQNANNRRGVDGFPQRLVVEADISAGNGSGERGARFGKPIDRFGKLPHHFGLFRTAEVQTIGRRNRPGAARGDVARGFDWHQRPLPSVASAKARFVPFTRTMAASPAPGTTSVFVRTM